MFRQSLAFLLLIGANILSLASGLPKTEAAKQILDIVNNSDLYDKDIIPFQNKSGPLEVVSTAFIRSIDIDDVNMRTIVDLTFRVLWRDYRLTYDEPGVTQVRFSDVSKFWIPDMFFRNSFKTEQMVSIHPESYIEVARKGDILYSSRFLLNLRCNMAFQRFPHDIQNCPIDIASYGYSTKDIVLYFEQEAPVTLAKNMELTSRFTVTRITSDYCTSKTVTGEYACLRITFTIDRSFMLYLLEWYLPCVSLVIIAFFSEFLEPSALIARLILTVGPLLTLMAASLKYSESLPSVAYSTCLDQFTGMSLLAIFATILHVLISHYFSQKPEEEIKPDVEGGASKLRTLYEKIKARGNIITKSLIIGIYCVYVFLYCLAYGLSRSPA